MSGSRESEAAVGPDAPVSIDTEQVENRLLEFIRSVAPGTAIGRDDDLLSGELLDSIAVLRLATFVGEELGIEIQPADFVIENFRSAKVLAAYVQRATASSTKWPSCWLI